MNLLWYLGGYREYALPVSEAKDFLNLCMCKGLIYSRFQTKEDCVRFRCTTKTARHLEACAGAFCLHPVCISQRGLPPFLFRHRDRAGILLGILLSLLVGGMLSRMIWSVEVTGNHQVSTGEVLAELQNAGLSVGSLRSGIDPDDIELRLLSSSEKLSWASVNLHGTVARVQVREKSSAESSDASGGVRKPANLIADSAGKILYMEILRGNPVICAGETVSRGDLLISGVFDSTAIGFRLTRAAGRVFAETAEEFRIEIPLVCTEYVANPDAEKDTYLNFFGKEIKVFKSTGNRDGNCDTIETVVEFNLPGGRVLPIAVKKLRYVTYSETERRLTNEEAENLAYFRLAGQIAEWLGGDGSLLRKNITVTMTENSCVLICNAIGIRNIAVISEFEADLPHKTNKPH